jgi:hypothetical protein
MVEFRELVVRMYHQKMAKHQQQQQQQQQATNYANGADGTGGDVGATDGETPQQPHQLQPPQQAQPQQVYASGNNMSNSFGAPSQQPQPPQQQGTYCGPSPVPGMGGFMQQGQLPGQPLLTPISHLGSQPQIGMQPLQLNHNGLPDASSLRPGSAGNLLSGVNMNLPGGQGHLLSNLQPNTMIYNNNPGFVPRANYTPGAPNSNPLMAQSGAAQAAAAAAAVARKPPAAAKRSAGAAGLGDDSKGAKKKATPGQPMPGGMAGLGSRPGQPGMPGAPQVSPVSVKRDAQDVVSITHKNKASSRTS